jgi:hypothetical protein
MVIYESKFTRYAIGRDSAKSPFPSTFKRVYNEQNGRRDILYIRKMYRPTPVWQQRLPIGCD